MLGGLKGQPGRTVQLADNDPLGAVDDKCALRRHERQFAHENFLLFSPLLFFEQERDVEGSAVSQSLAQAFEPIHLRLADFVGVEVQDAFAIVALDGKHLGEHGLQSQVFPFGRRYFGLQKFPIRIGLQFDEVRRGDDFFDLAEVDSFDCARWHLDLYSLAGNSAEPFVTAKRQKASTPRSTRTADLL